jgi:hypothetical protein
MSKLGVCQLFSRGTRLRTSCLIILCSKIHYKADMPNLFLKSNNLQHEGQRQT